MPTRTSTPLQDFGSTELDFRRAPGRLSPGQSSPRPKGGEGELTARGERGLAKKVPVRVPKSLAA